jgi:hypothetical protein
MQAEAAYFLLSIAPTYECKYLTRHLTMPQFSVLDNFVIAKWNTIRGENTINVKIARL